MKKSLLFLLFISIGLFLSSCEKEPSSPIEETGLNQDIFDYLDNQSIEIDLSNENALMPISEILEDTRFIMTGETHGIQVNYDIELAMVKFLVEREWLDYYVPELPISFCYFLNQYLENGDESILDRLFQPIKGTFFWTKEAYDHWKNIYAYYQSLPPEKRFQIVGIEIEHQSQNALWMLYDVFPETAPSGNLAPIYEQIETLYFSGSSHIWQLYQITNDLEDLIVANSFEYKDYFGDNWKDLLLVINNIQATIKGRQSGDELVSRETSMYENFIAQFNELAPGNFYGQWGANHIHQRVYNQVVWLAQRLNEGLDSPVKDQVTSFLYTYDDSMMLLRSPYREADYSNIQFKEMFKQVAQGQATLIPLAKPGSPFRQELIWPSFRPTVPGNGVTTDYYQYLILFRNAEAATPLM